MFATIDILRSLAQRRSKTGLLFRGILFWGMGFSVLSAEPDSTALSPSLIVSRPTGPRPAVQKPPAGQSEIPLEESLLIIQVFVVDPAPCAVEEFLVHWPQDANKSFTRTWNNYDVTLTIERVESTTRQPDFAYIEVQEVPFLQIVGRVDLNRPGRGGAMGSSSIYLCGSQHAGGSSIVDGLGAVSVVAIANSGDPLQKTTLGELVKSEWGQLAPQLVRWGSSDTPGKTHSAWEKLAGSSLLELPDLSERQAILERRYANAGVKEGGHATFRSRELIDLDTETVREWADGDDWPPGFDLLWDETAKTWTARRWSSVAMVSVPASGIFKAFDAAHTLKERFESASPTASATGDILVRTTEQRFALVTHSGSSVSKPLIGRRRTTTSFVWYWLIEKPQATPALLPTQDSTTSPAATAPASTQP